MGHYLRVIALAVAGLALVAAPACGESKDRAQGSPAGKRGEQNAAAAEDGAEAKEKQTFKGTEKLPSSKNVVLGLRVPKGMNPMPAPKGVYRFEGIFPVPQVADYIKEAVKVDVVTQTGHKTFEFRNAKVKAPVGRTENAAVLGIKVTRAVPHGSRLDIWMEEPAETGAAAASGSRTGAAARGPIAAPAARLSKGESEKRAQQRKRTLDALIKTQSNKKQKLSAEEKDLLH